MRKVNKIYTYHPLKVGMIENYYFESARGAEIFLHDSGDFSITMGQDTTWTSKANVRWWKFPLTEQQDLQGDTATVNNEPKNDKPRRKIVGTIDSASVGANRFKNI